MKKVFALFCAIILIFSLSFSSFAISLPEPTNDFFVNDFVNIIDEDDDAEIMKIGADLYEQTTAQIIIVTIDSLDGYDVDEYALELGREWGVGSENNDNGVVILLSLSDREISIQVGYGLEGCLNDGKIGRILDDYAIPYLTVDDFSTGLIEAYKAVAYAVCEEYDVELNPEYEIDNYETNELNDDFGADATITLFFALLIVVIIVVIFDKFLKNGPPSDGNGNGTYHGGGRYYGGPTIYRGGFSGGSRGGFSGGGGGFRGGGGSFGGGGASRGF
ncbi:MAG: TPM domain-containing protein [Clostridia bacterium]|nr:TPM domain-containing protein [Clostridia bacterium]